MWYFMYVDLHLRKELQCIGTARSWEAAAKWTFQVAILVEGGREAGEGGKERVGNLDNLGTVVFLKGKSSGITWME